MTDKPDLTVVPDSDQEKAPTPTPPADPNRADPAALTVTGLVRSIGALTRQVADDQRIPIGAATAIVKAGLDFHLSTQALALQQRSAIPFPPIPAAEDSNDESND